MLQNLVGPLQTTALIIGLYLAVAWFALVLWTWRDISRRTHDPILRVAAVGVVIAGFLPGLVIYLMLRPTTTLAERFERDLGDEVLIRALRSRRSCSSCGGTIRADFLVCPHCRMRARVACAGCDRALEPWWSACPYCAHERVVAPAPAVPAAPAPAPARAPIPVAAGAETRPGQAA